MRKLKSNSEFLWGLIIAVLLMAIPALIDGCKNNEPILIGFTAQLTGKQAEFGIQERNAVQLAVEAVNASVGIAGRKIQLIIRDDLGKPEIAQSVDREMIDAGVLAIIGHVTSGQTIAGLEVANPARVVMLGPTVSSPILSGLDDYFFRIYPSFKDSSQAFTRYIYQRDGIKRLGIIYDSDNAAYTETYSTIVADEFLSLGGKLAGEIKFSSGTQPDFTPLIMKLRENKADGLIIIASDIDTALIAQKVRLMDWQLPLFASAWAQSETLINKGGHAIEGMKLEQALPLDSQSPSLLEFQALYKARFGYAPSFGAILAYETTQVLATALEKTGGEAEGLKQAILDIQDYHGLFDSFSFDEYGDVERTCYISTISDGKFVTIDNH